MKNRWLAITAASLVLICTVAVKPAIAYFTDTISAEIKRPVILGDSKLPEIDEDVENMIKKITIQNTGEYDILVRAKAIFPSTVTISMEESTGWSAAEDGYYYYDEILIPGQASEKLNLKIEHTGDDDFNVIIVQEATKVLYTEEGTPYGDWNSAISVQLTNEPVSLPAEQMR